MTVLVLLRHGESAWNAADVFTGWIDVGLSGHGRQQAQRAGAILAARGFLPDAVHTSVQRRAIVTADLALAACGRSWVPARRSWRLNSNHYGALQGRGKAEVRAEAGDEQYSAWRRGFHVRPPLGEADHDRRYAALHPDARPRGECASCLTGATRSSPTCTGMAACWWYRTATRCGRGSSTWRASATTHPPHWRCRTRYRCFSSSRPGTPNGWRSDSSSRRL